MSARTSPRVRFKRSGGALWLRQPVGLRQKTLVMNTGSPPPTLSAQQRLFIMSRHIWWTTRVDFINKRPSG